VTRYSISKYNVQAAQLGKIKHWEGCYMYIYKADKKIPAVNAEQYWCFIHSAVLSTWYCSMTKLLTCFSLIHSVTWLRHRNNPQLITKKLITVNLLQCTFSLIYCKICAYTQFVVSCKILTLLEFMIFAVVTKLGGIKKRYSVWLKYCHIAQHY